MGLRAIDPYFNMLAENSKGTMTDVGGGGIGSQTLPRNSGAFFGIAAAGTTLDGILGGAAAAGEGAGALGLGATGALLAPLLLSGDTQQTKPYLYVTYTRTNPQTGQVYSGRTSGYGDPETLVLRRGSQQGTLNAEGFLPPVVDQATTNSLAQRGREQQLIDFNGGARSVGGITRNMINGVADFNPQRPFYMDATRRTFGNLPDNSPARWRLDFAH